MAFDCGLPWGSLGPLVGFAGPVGPVETPQGQGEAKKEGGAGQVMFPGWLDQPPWKHHRDKARQRRMGRAGVPGDPGLPGGPANPIHPVRVREAP